MKKTSLSPIPPKETNAKINKLRELRKEAIKKHDFSQAQEIDKQIEQVKLEVTDRQKQIVRLNFDEKIRLHVKQCNIDLDKLDKDFDEQIHTVRTRYHRFFQDTQLSQKTELLNAEREFQDSLSREHLRRIPDCEDILAQSRKAATNGQYEQAMALKEEATKAAQIDLEKRTSAVTNDFEDKRSKLLDQFEEVITQLGKKFDEEIKIIEEKKKQQIKDAQDNREGQIKATLEKSKLQLVSSAATTAEDATRLLLDDLREILEELGCPMPSKIGSETPSPKSSPRNTKQTLNVDEK